MIVIMKTFMIVMVVVAALMIVLIIRNTGREMRVAYANSRQQLQAAEAILQGSRQRLQDAEAMLSGPRPVDHAKDAPHDSISGEFQRLCQEWERLQHASQYGGPQAAQTLTNVTAKLESSMELMISSDAPELGQQLCLLIAKGSPIEAHWAGRVAARRRDIACFEALWARVSSRHGLAKEVFDLLGAAAAEFPREHTAPLLVKVLESEDYFVREAACGMLEWCPSAAAVEGLCATLKTTSMSERDAAIAALVALGDEAVPALTAIAQGPRGNAREAALIALSQIPNPDALRLAFEASLIEDALLRSQAFATSVDRCAQRLRLAAHQNIPDAGKAETLGRSFHGLLCEVASSTDAKRRLFAVEQLGQLPLPESMELISRILDTEKDPQIKAIAMRSQRYRSDPAVRERAWRDIVSENGSLRSEAFLILVRKLEDVTIEKLHPALTHADMNVRVTAISLLGRTRGDTVRRCLIDFTRDPSPTVVARACNLLENETITEADLEWMRPLCAIHDAAIRNSVARMLIAVDSESSRGLLLEMLAYDPGGIIADYLGLSYDPRVFWPLFEQSARQGKNAETAPSAVVEQAVNHQSELLKLLDSPKRNIRVLAISLLDTFEVPAVASELRRRTLAGEEETLIHGTLGLVKKNDQVIINSIRQQIETDGKYANTLAFKYYDTNTPLREPARTWLENHGYRIITVPAIQRRGRR
ncbi:MAG: HEAT repeat protein [Verrucomicrobia bacterium ADurb.Bin070]|mgnify:CR=1 FL=1|nr:MAG: HEAT repeat protein [Verrucomicrobia bacterium ADurb.Bin070]